MSLRPTLRMSGSYQITLRIRHDAGEGELVYCAADLAWKGSGQDPAEWPPALAAITQGDVEERLRQLYLLDGEGWSDAEWPAELEELALERVRALWPGFFEADRKVAPEVGAR